MSSWDVIYRGKVIDTVFFLSNMDYWEVYNSLVNHDGYPPEICLS